MENTQINNGIASFAIGISLGHNSSASLVAFNIDGSSRVVAAYEEERLTRIKSDGSWPEQAILACVDYAQSLVPIGQCAARNFPWVIQFSHWFDVSLYAIVANNDFANDVLKRITRKSDNIVPLLFTTSSFDSRIVTLKVDENRSISSSYFENNLEGYENAVGYIGTLTAGIAGQGGHLMTHHEAHAFSALTWAKGFFKYEVARNGVVFVSDGFGNNGEVFSVFNACIEPNYTSQGVVQKARLHRDVYGDSRAQLAVAYGFENSLGLMYQWATEYLGMKPHADEYKLLGYKAKAAEIFEYSLPQFSRLLNEAFDVLHVLYNSCYDSSDEKGNEFDTLILNIRNGGSGRNQPECDQLKQQIIDLPYLHKTQAQFNFVFAAAIKRFKARLLAENLEAFSSVKDATRVIGALIVQEFLVKQYLHRIDLSGALNKDIGFIVFTGGVHLNVELNLAITNHIRLKVGHDKVKICFQPVCGDQGAAIGLIAAQDTIWDTLYLQHRVNSGAGVFTHKSFYESHALANEYESSILFKPQIEEIAELLADDNIVHLYSSESAEFGPRALCATSCLALPTAENQKFINEINGRNDVMPFAPVIADEMANEIFSYTLDDNRQPFGVCGSYQYMITSCEIWRRFVNSKMQGVCHKTIIRVPSSGFANIINTARPQIINSDVTTQPLNAIRHILSILYRDSNMPCLINTSFNVHGQPIVHSIHDALTNHAQCVTKAMELGTNRGVFLVII